MTQLDTEWCDGAKQFLVTNECIQQQRFMESIAYKGSNTFIRNSVLFSSKQNTDFFWLLERMKLAADKSTEIIIYERVSVSYCRPRLLFSVN